MKRLILILTTLLLVDVYARDRYDYSKEVRVSTYVVAAQNAADRSKSQADYVCDGTDDQVQIQNAIDKLEAGVGGSLYLTEGTFSVDPMSVTASNITIEGSGAATIIQLTAQDLDVLGQHMIFNVYGTSGTHIENVTIRNMQIDGNKANMTGTTSLSMEIINYTYVDYGIIENCRIKNAIAEGIDLDNSTNIIITKNFVTGCGGYGIHCSEGAEDNLISFNVVSSCGADWSRGGIDQHVSANDNMFIGNWTSGNTLQNIHIRNDSATVVGNYTDGTNDIFVGRGVMPIVYPSDQSSYRLWEWRVEATTQDLVFYRNYGDSWGAWMYMDRSARNMSIGNGTAPAASAVLQLDSTTGAFLPPRMTSTQRDALTAVNGMIIYNTTTNKTEARENGSWVDM